MMSDINEKLWERLQKEFVLEHHRVSSCDNENQLLEVGDVIQFYHPNKPTGLWPIGIGSRCARRQRWG